MWDQDRVLRGFWQRIAGIFGGKKQRRPPPGGIPAPETLVARVAAVQNKDRDMLRLADEAIRRGHPDQAVIAYWKAVRVYTNDGQHLKAVSALKMILQHVPDSVEAHLALIEAYVALSRARDAANVCIALADAHVEVGRRDEALGVLTRALHLDPLVKGARERITALGGVMPTAAPVPVIEPSPPPETSPAPEPRPRSGGLPPIQPAPIQPAPIPQLDDAGPLELDIEGDDALDFPDDSLVVPVVEPTAHAESAPEPEPELEPDVEDEPDDGAATIFAMEAVTPPSDEGDATLLGMEAVTPPAEDEGAATILQMEAIPGNLDQQPTDETAAQRPRFSIPNQATTFEGGLPSALVGSEHDPGKEEEPVIGGSTRAYGPDELRALGIKVPED